MPTKFNNPFGYEEALLALGVFKVLFQFLLAKGGMKTRIFYEA